MRMKSNAGAIAGSGYKALQRGETANIVKARHLHGTLQRISDRDKREGGCVIAGENCMSAEATFVLPASRGAGIRMQKSAEAIVGVSTSRRAEH